jgi:formate dehydrogenase iron-sulfur subunit
MEIKRRDLITSGGTKATESHDANKVGMLVDTTLCIGCRACVVACKQWNHNPSSDFVDPAKEKTVTATPLLDSNTFTNIRVTEITDGLQPRWVYTKIQCMHCNDPACVTACPIRAMRKTKNGPVIYDTTKCFGCRYCMTACPFHIPDYQWDSTLPWVRKCTFCVNRQEVGLQPACSGTCPTGALKFGKREDLLVVAKKRISDDPTLYVNHIYGEREIGGTSWIYLSSVPFEELGFKKFGSDPVPKNAERAMKLVPPVLVGVALVCSGLYWYTRRREQMAKEKIEGK